MATSVPVTSRRKPSLSISDTSSSGLSNDDYTSDEERELRLEEQREWEEGIEQLQVLVSVVMIPMLGKYLGRRWSGWRKP